MENKIEEINEKAKYCLNCKVKPCTKGCPLGNDIPTFIRALKEEKYGEAYETLLDTTVLGAICGRICPHQKQCQGSCVRGIKGDSVSIGDLEAFVFDKAIQEEYEIKKESNQLENKKVAVIGSGPAGLTCSAFLAKNGAEVTIYEKQELLGGILRYGIPEFRLPKEILDKTIETILKLGIKVKSGTTLGKENSLEELQKQYDAIFLGFGANVSSKMNIEGELLEGVYGGNELLETGNHPNYTGKDVAVIGGGNVAMDTARTIKALGANQVFVIYRRAKEQMPAEAKEIEDAIEEGVTFLFQTNIVKIIEGNGKKVEKIECIKTELIKKEGEARAVPVTIENSNYEMSMDFVVMAVGSKTDECVVTPLDIETTKYGYIVVNENYMTSKEKVFAGGDLAGTKATVAWAARSGREAAKAITKYVSNS